MNRSGGGAFAGAGRGPRPRRWRGTSKGGGAFAPKVVGLIRTPHSTSLRTAIDSSPSVALAVGQQLRRPRNHDMASPILASRRKRWGGWGEAPPNATTEPKLLWQLSSDARYAALWAQVLHRGRFPGGSACSSTRRTWRLPLLQFVFAFPPLLVFSGGLFSSKAGLT